MDSHYFESFNVLHDAIEKFDISSSPQDEEALIEQLACFEILTFSFSKVVPNFQRLTINKNLPDNNNSTVNLINFLKNPPVDSVTKHGRANLKGQTMLYGTFLLPTALAENNPDIGDLITISYWKLKNENSPLTVYPVFDYFKTKNFQLKQAFTTLIKDYPEVFKDILIIDSCLVASCFSKYIEKGKEINYTLSAHYANRILHEMHNGEINAIIYPSVKDTTRVDNIAIKPNVFNDMYKLAEVRESLVVSKENGMILLHEQKRTKNFEDNLIIWK